MSRKASEEEAVPPVGFDAPVTDRSDDHLNRWPLARQVYRVAVNGPPEWSARVGVYGAWGSGKTSVLRFVESMAKKDKHIIVWFDPWAYSTKPELWQAFVEAVGEAAEEKLGTTVAVRDKGVKKFTGKAAGFLGKLAKAVPAEGASAVGEGLTMLQAAFAFTKEDLKGLLKALGGRRVLVVIDDLDRTAAELVPEILYSLKEVMDVPGFSFVCGFDPDVVSKVLKSRHEGFDDGLKFLEKIIDYPVWLPPPTREGLANIAFADAERYAPFVPRKSLGQVLDLLPENPRSVRQFVRLISMLEDQVERYDDGELNWWMILASNAIQARWPKIDASKLHSEKFYDDYRITEWLGGEDHKERPQFIKEHVTECCGAAGIGEEDQIEGLCAAMRRLCDGNSMWGDVGTGGSSAQARIAISPQVLTLREFREIAERWEGPKSIESVRKAISRHADRQGFSKAEVLKALVPYLVQRFDHEATLSHAAFTAADAKRHRNGVRRALTLLEASLLKPGELCPSAVTGSWIPLEQLFDKFLSLADSGGTVDQEFWTKISKVLKRIIELWKDDLMPLAAAVHAYRPNMGKGLHLDGEASKAFAKELIATVDGRLAELVADEFSTPGFLRSVFHQQENTRPLHELVFTHTSVLWTTHRAQFLKAVRKAGESPGGRENAYKFVESLTHFLVKPNSPFRSWAKQIITDHEFVRKIWTAATAKPFRGLHAYRIREFPEQAKASGVELCLPSWWQVEIDAFEAQIRAEKARRGGSEEKSKAEPDSEPTAVTEEE